MFRIPRAMACTPHTPLPEAAAVSQSRSAHGILVCCGGKFSVIVYTIYLGRRRSRPLCLCVFFFAKVVPLVFLQEEQDHIVPLVFPRRIMWYQLGCTGVCHAGCTVQYSHGFISYEKTANANASNTYTRQPNGREDRNNPTPQHGQQTIYSHVSYDVILSNAQHGRRRFICLQHISKLHEQFVEFVEDIQQSVCLVLQYTSLVYLLNMHAGTSDTCRLLIFSCIEYC